MKYQTWSKGETDFFRALIAGKVSYAEYGIGTATEIACTSPLTNIISVANDRLLAEQFFSANHILPGQFPNNRVTLLVVDLGPAGGTGIPLDGSRASSWSQYVDAPFSQKIVPDIVLINGPFKVACMLRTVLDAPEADVVVKCDDFSRFNLIEPFLTTVEQCDSLVYLRRNPQISNKNASNLLTSFAYNPMDTILGLPPSNLKTFLMRL